MYKCMNVHVGISADNLYFKDNNKEMYTFH